MTGCPVASRRGFIAGVSGIAGGLAGALGTQARAATPAATEPFWGERQGGILTPSQNHTYFAAFDVVAKTAGDLAAMLQAWTAAAARMAAGQTAMPLGGDANVAAGDSGEAVGLAPARLTLTFGFGPGLFGHAGQDRFGLAARRPAALVDLPRFNGDQMIETRTGGDISVQACADDPQVAFHAVRQLARLAYGAVQLRWVQTGFSADFAAPDTPRNLLGFKDGTQNPLARPGDHGEMLWVGDEGPGWMRGGSYVVVRRIRVSLEHWDRSDTAFQEQVIGRRKASGAPLGSPRESDALDLDATGPDGNPVIPDDAHVRLAAASTNQGAQILRRGYSYNDGAAVTAERWPPWRQGMMYDAGLFFVAYQRDPRTGFIQIYRNMARLDALGQFATHVGGGLFACPGGLRPGDYIGQGLFEPA